MQRVGAWQRFRPKIRGRLDDKTVYEGDSLYGHARVIVDETMREARKGLAIRESMKRASRAAKLLREREVHDAAYLLAALILQAPGAVRAQNEMDEHHGGYRNREARLYELIDFNDTFVDTVLALPEHELPEFAERLRAEIDNFCGRLHVPTFTDRQYEAIVHGLSREIAVYRAARANGLIARMTSRVQDAMGIDMIITDPVTKKSINIDCKTHSSFHFRLVDLERQRRIDEQQRLDCELAGYCTIHNGAKPRGVDTVLLRVATDHLGPIRNFSFEDTGRIVQLLRAALANDGRYITHID